MVISTDREEIGSQLDELQTAVAHDIPCTQTLSYTILKIQGAYRILENRCELFSLPDPGRVIPLMHELITDRVLSGFPDCLRIHSGCGTLNGRRFLLIGPKGAGKTTLLCRLTLDGGQAHCDEYVLVNDHEVIPFPRKFHLKEGTLEWIPELNELCKRKTPFPAYFGGSFYFFDPTDLGSEWTFPIGPIHSIFYLERNSFQQTEVEKIPAWQMVQKILFQTRNFFSADPKLQIMKLCRMINGSRCFTLSVGNLGRAEEIMHRSLS